MKNALVCIACLLICRPSMAATPIKTFIIAGQSNAVGGAWPPYPPDELLDPQRSLYNYRLDAGFGVLESPTWEQVRTLWPSFPHNVSFGVEITFAYEMEKRLGQPIAIIKVAANASSLHERWHPSVDDLYPWMLDKVQASIGGLRIAGYSPDLAGLIWIQGEADAGVGVWANQYQANLHDLVNTLRGDLDVAEMPVALNLLHLANWYPARDAVREQQLAFAADDPFATAFDPSDLPIGSDNVHYPNESFLELGVRFADVFAPPPVYAEADFNEDGGVDSADLDAWSGAFALDTAVGDADDDGDSDGEDFLAWQRQLSTPDAPEMAIPEPAGWKLIGLLLGAAPWHRSRQTGTGVIS